MALASKNKEGFLDGSCTAPAQTDKKFRQWARCNLMVLNWILNSMEKSLRDNFKYVRSTKVLWSEFNEHYGLANAIEIYQIKKDMDGVTQGNASLIEYYSRLKNFWETLDNLDPLPVCSYGKLDSCTYLVVKRMFEREQNAKLIQFLMGLINAYDHVRTQILSIDALPTISKLVYFYSRHNKCAHYNKQGHNITICYDLHGFPGKDKSKGKFTGQKGKRRANNVDVIDTNKASCSSSSSLDHAVIDGLVISVVDQVLKRIVDSHSTAAAHFAGMVPISLVHSVGLPDGTSKFVHIVGDLKLTDHITLLNVFYIPEFRQNLLSVGRLIDDNNVNVLFLSNKCVFQARSSKQIIGIGRREGDLYRIQQMHKNMLMDNVTNLVKETIHNKLLVNKCSSLFFSKNEQVKLMHIRSGHMAIDKLKLYFSSCISFSFTSYGCIGGPYKVPTLSGAKYFFTLLDDHTRTAWVILFHHKDHVAALVKDFLVHVHTRFGVVVKIIRTDNGTKDVLFKEDQFHFKTVPGTQCNVDTPLDIVNLASSTLLVPHSITAHKDNVIHPDTERRDGILITQQNGDSSVQQTADQNQVHDDAQFNAEQHQVNDQSIDQHRVDTSVVQSQPNAEQHIIQPHSSIQKLPSSSSFQAAVLSNISGYHSEYVASLANNHTCELVDLPVGQKAIGSKWVYKIKYNPNGTVERFKARLVAKGYNQVKDKDYAHTFLPVAKFTTVTTLLALAAIKGWMLHQLDINNAFFAWWNKELTKYLQSLGFQQSKHDYSLYTRYNPTLNTFVLNLVYVDDVLLTGDSNVEISDVKKGLDTTFSIKDLGYMRYFLGLEISRNSTGIQVNQRKYIMDILSDLNMVDSAPTKFPMQRGLKLTIDEGELL
ncbi:uncharacterized protein LOC141608323 [Silene latifolia]|uniref:uncharacterized protein LOC141608323 n=1 Tax=Silene latifolia TaxID=37657 RepID=UPI003D7813AE